MHDTSFEQMGHGSNLDVLRLLVSPTSQSQTNSTGEKLCSYRVRVFPTSEFQKRFVTHKPIIYAAFVVMIFVSTSTVFFLYDFLVRQRQAKVLRSAMVNSTIVSSLFPANVRGRLIESSQLTSKRKLYKQGNRDASSRSLTPSPRLQLTNYLAKPVGNSATDIIDNEPIADLFPHTTVFFADIAGFTAWSSEREPSHVFKLLETVYSSFDVIAASLGVFKVETVGDCYVAVTGLPTPQDDHAVIMALFAQRCISKMRELTKQLEGILGPSTGDLALRVGMHSGPVIAGVLRGTMSRFQLFGDTMNTASRMESNGVINKIQVSSTTAKLLQQAGKSGWVTAREDSILVKGKGSMQTYWLLSTSCNDDGVSALTVATSYDPPTNHVIGAPENPTDQLIRWNVDLLYRHLQKIEARRRALSSRSRRNLRVIRAHQETATASGFMDGKRHPRDEIVESFCMPDCTATPARHRIEPPEIELPDQILDQLRNFVHRVAALYDNNNAFHNLEHACHVAMSTARLLKRIIAPNGVDYQQNSTSKRQRIQALEKEIHKTTFGISSDPLMQFAAVFAALIHDADHKGVPNSQLSAEKSPLAIQYQHRSVAEQHSVEVAWNFLMEDQYNDLRRCICDTEAEMLRFRQLVVNAVIATDIADPLLRSWREQRWETAFSSQDSSQESANQKASIVFDYILQASDVAHTMQHWQTFCKWNRRLFTERYCANKKGRSEKDPSLRWYEEELSFFDNYIIPLAEKLEDCGVFGVSSDEYLTHAIENRHEWAMKGHEIVKDMLLQCEDFAHIEITDT